MTSLLKPKRKNSRPIGKRPASAKAKRKSKAGSPIGVKRLAARYLALLLGFGERVADSQGLSDSEQVAKLRNELQVFENTTTLLLLDLDGKRRPQATDLVMGEVCLKRGKSSLWARLYGKVVGCDEHGSVRVQFEHFEYESDDGEDWDKQAAKYLHKEFRAHAAEMDWDDGDQEWSVVLTP